MQGIQLNQIQAPLQQQLQPNEIKTEYQSQQKTQMQLIRPQTVNQSFINQSLPSNSVNLNMDQSASTSTIDDNLSNAAANSASTSYNQKTSERMRQDEGNYYLKIKIFF